eukprot:SM000090S24354  [mRNA]  locus=s90:545822:548138:- [translate_table: standard]
MTVVRRGRDGCGAGRDADAARSGGGSVGGLTRGGSHHSMHIEADSGDDDRPSATGRGAVAAATAAPSAWGTAAVRGLIAKACTGLSLGGAGSGGRSGGSSPLSAPLLAHGRPPPPPPPELAGLRSGGAGEDAYAGWEFDDEPYSLSSAWSRVQTFADWLLRRDDDRAYVIEDVTAPQPAAAAGFEDRRSSPRDAGGARTLSDRDGGKWALAEGPLESTGRQGHGGGGGGPLHQLLEVLPVLAVVAVGVLGTFCYLALFGGGWPYGRPAFSAACDLSAGVWVNRSSEPPLYNATCPYIRDPWNCAKYHGRGSGASLAPLEHSWCWEPAACRLDRFSASTFLARMRGRRLAFVGDRVVGNQFDSFVCMLADAETPERIQTEDSGSRDDGADGAHITYRFYRSNVTIAHFHSTFLVKVDTAVDVNVTECRLNHANASAAAAASLSASPTTSLSAPADSLGGAAVAVEPALEEACYPNRLSIDEPDPVWATEAHNFDALVLGSGGEWREEALESQGLAIHAAGVRQVNMSLEGVSGEWAYPRAMAAVASWLSNPANFAGIAVFRSFSPRHQHKECAGQSLLTRDAAVRLSQGGEAYAFNMATATALAGSRLRYLNITLMSLERGEGHPWMSSPLHPKPDCTHWCLPGVPDSWNEALAALLLRAYPANKHR